jgi:diguanylate cyclase (GGDEF)-like protein
LEISSFHDGLTGLYNRKFYEEEVKRIFSNKRNYPISLIMGDLDGLKMTNDTLGHIKGDEMIINAAQCLAKIFRKDDAVARIGGDEFAVVLSNTSEEKVKLIYQRILDENEKMNKGLEVPFNISLGYATQNHPEDVFERAYKEADNLMYSNKLKNDQSSKNNMISSLLLVLTSKDSTSETHLSITSEIIEKFAKFLGIKDKKIEELKLFAKFHDIGKAGVPDAILLKKEKLTLEEFEEIKRHSEIGYKLTKFVPYLAFAAEWILRHHERWDGGGYPGKLAGEEIPLESRIMAIVDSYEAMTSGNRTYRQTKTKPEAIEEIKACSGTQFDPGLTASFIKFLETSLN